MGLEIDGIAAVDEEVPHLVKKIENAYFSHLFRSLLEASGRPN
jgi:hypothetical protein